LNELIRHNTRLPVTLSRKTLETDIELAFNIDGTGICEVNTGIGFFDHMLASFSRHGGFDLYLNCKGDLEVDGHHTVEDVAIVLGLAIKQSIGSKGGIARFGSQILPMDDALVLCAVDLSSRPYFSFDVDLGSESVGFFDTQLVKEFFYTLSYSGAFNLHLKKFSGQNCHHIIEACYKAFGYALKEAGRLIADANSVLSTKGSL